jgi:tetratricopeptide (TPR) repeat protein
MDDVVKALADLNFALALQPDHARARFLRGQVYRQQRRWQEACDDFTWLLQRQPSDHELYRLRGACRIGLGDHAGAAADFGEWLKYGDVDANTLNTVAWLLVGKSKERKNAELALPLIEKAAAQLPSNVHIVHTLGVTYYRLERFQEAVTTLQRAGKLRGPQPSAYELYFLAMCRHNLGDAAGARHDFDQAVRWQQQAKLLPAQTAELESFRAEAEALLPAETK